MLAKVLSGAVIGIDAYVVEVEVDISAGLPSFTTVGLPEAAVKESKERVKAAIQNSGYRFPDDRITINLAPADIKKEGTGLDLPIALGILAAVGLIPKGVLADYMILGELSLDGRVKPVRGSLPVALTAMRAGYAGIMVPAGQQPRGRRGSGNIGAARHPPRPGGRFLPGACSHPARQNQSWHFVFGSGTVCGRFFSMSWGRSMSSGPSRWRLPDRTIF